MRILFGPENDHRHTASPALSGAYEWWYFDALSEDGRYAVVAIFFLGSPMTPYYKAVADGKCPDPMDWCGVFFTLHEKVAGKWKERAYAYNLYRDGEFCADGSKVAIGGSRMTYDGAGTWTVSVRERGLWRSHIHADLHFTMPAVTATLPVVSDLSENASHSWICTAPVCRMTAEIAVNARSVRFQGEGYHDHNFGALPLSDVAIWYWARASLTCTDGAARTAILYCLLPNGAANSEVTALVFDDGGNAIVFADDAVGCESSPITNAYGLTHSTVIAAESDEGRLTAAFLPSSGQFTEGPFYRRLPVHIKASFEPGWSGEGEGIGEVFVPLRLCGPIASRAMWSRIRRRNRP